MINKKCANPNCNKSLTRKRRGAKFCSRACWKTFGLNPSVRALGTMNRVAFHPERLTNLSNIIELDSNELAEMVSTRELLTSVNYSYYVNSNGYSLIDPPVLTDPELTNEQQSKLLKLLGIELNQFDCGVMLNVRFDSDIPLGSALLVFNKPVSVMELSKGERVQLAAKLLGEKEG